MIKMINKMMTKNKKIKKINEKSDDKLPPFFSRVGGKTKLRKKISAIIPKDSKIYVEAFVGAGSIFLYKRKFDKEVINDLDKGIYHIWNDMKNHGETLKNASFIPSRTKFNRLLKKKNI